MRDQIFKNVYRSVSTTHYHVLAWVVFISYEVTLSAAIRGSYNHVADYLLRYPIYILLFYAHCYLVLGRIKFKNLSDYGRLVLLVSVEMSLYYLCNVLINDLFVSFGIPVNISETSSRKFNLATIYRFIYIVGLSTGLRISLNLIESETRNFKFVTEKLTLEKEKESLRAELATAELSFLRTQINPHLLFNSLNSVYNRIRKKDERSGEYVLALADLMQYALQKQNSAEAVLLATEVEHLSSYIKLQGMRYSQEIAFSVSVDDPEVKIIPFLLVSLVENIFQHGDLKQPEIPSVEITVRGGIFELYTRNVIRIDRRPGNGLGLSNTRRRLELHYPRHHQLEYAAQKNIFNLKLTLNLNHHARI